MLNPGDRVEVLVQRFDRPANRERLTGYEFEISNEWRAALVTQGGDGGQLVAMMRGTQGHPHFVAINPADEGKTWRRA